jgi:hypothetical protein
VVVDQVLQEAAMELQVLLMQLQTQVAEQVVMKELTDVMAVLVFLVL